MTLGKQIYYHNLRENIKNMHPKFKELAVQAGAYPEGNTVLTGPMDVAKFAELIVTECGRVADQWVNDEDNGTNLVSAKLQQHFGVKK